MRERTCRIRKASLHRFTIDRLVKIHNRLDRGTRVIVEFSPLGETIGQERRMRELAARRGRGPATRKAKRARRHPEAVQRCPEGDLSPEQAEELRRLEAMGDGGIDTDAFPPAPAEAWRHARRGPVRGADLMKLSGTIWGGRKPVRAALYMATLVATRPIQPSAPSTNACVPTAKPRSSPSPPACASSWSSSTPCSPPAYPGGPRSQLDSSRQSLTPKASSTNLFRRSGGRRWTLP